MTKEEKIAFEETIDNLEFINLTSYGKRLIQNGVRELEEELAKFKETGMIIEKFNKTHVCHMNPFSPLPVVRLEYEQTKEDYCNKLNEVIDRINYLLKKEGNK